MDIFEMIVAALLLAVLVIVEMVLKLIAMLWTWFWEGVGGAIVGALCGLALAFFWNEPILAFLAKHGVVDHPLWQIGAVIGFAIGVLDTANTIEIRVIRSSA